MLEIRPISPHLTLGLLDLAEFSKINRINVKRDVEKAGTRHLLCEMLSQKDVPLMYTSFNKPYLQGRTEHLSISHSHDKLAILINQKENTGVDIERVRDKVRNIQEKFLSPSELGYARDKVDLLLTLWAAKEAMYKVHGEKELEFAKHLQVAEFSSNEFEGRIILDNFSKRYWLRAEDLGEYKLVYVLYEIQKNNQTAAEG